MKGYVLLLLALGSEPLVGGDWPQWRGPRRDGISPESGWLERWPSQTAPKIAWRKQVGKGHSAVSVSGERAYSIGWDGRLDSVYCFDVHSGRLIWKQSYPCATLVQWPGPRATPTIQAGTVYTLSQHGQLRAWDATTGDPRWQRDLPQDYEPDPDYGFVWSPLIVSVTPHRPHGQAELLILNAGSRGLAVDARDGSLAWGNDGKKGACVSAVPFMHEGKQSVLVVSINDERTAANLVAVEAATGRELWRWNGWQERWGAMGVDPVVFEEKIFLTSAQEYRQAARLSIVGTTLKIDWSTHRVAGYTSGAVLIDAHLYLVDSQGILKCIDWNHGQERWVQRGFGDGGTLMAADGKLIIQSGLTGELIIAVADPVRYQELRRVTVFERDAKTFTVPVLAQGQIFCRSYAGEIVCLDLRAP